MTILLVFETLSAEKQKILAASQWKKMERRKKEAMLFDLSQHGDQPNGEESHDEEENLERKWESPMCSLCWNREKRHRKEAKGNIVIWVRSQKSEHFQEYPKVACRDCDR